MIATMQTRFAAATALLIAAAGAQDVVADGPALANLRRTFADWPLGACAFVVAVVDGGEPIVLCHGDDTHGAAATPLTSWPVGSLARLLVADALYVAFGGKLDRPAGFALGGAEPTVLDLLRTDYANVNQIPDYWDWRPDAAAIDAATLRACADVAAAAGFGFDADRAGMADLTLLSPRALTAHGDWESMLRVHLSPHVSGFAPGTAGQPDVEAWARTSMASTIALHAEPTVLRLMASAKDLAGWWRWRVARPLPLWEGFRMGHRWEVPRREGVETWRFADFGTRPVKTFAAAYPKHRSGLLCVSVGPQQWIPLQEDTLAEAFEADLFGELPAEVAVRLGGRMGPDRRRPLREWVDRRWVAAAGTPPCEIRVVDATDRRLRFEFDGRTFWSAQTSRAQKALRVVVSGDAGGGVLWLCPQTGKAGTAGAAAVFVERGDLFTVPHLLRLVDAEGQ